MLVLAVYVEVPKYPYLSQPHARIRPRAVVFFGAYNISFYYVTTIAFSGLSYGRLIVLLWLLAQTLLSTSTYLHPSTCASFNSRHILLQNVGVQTNIREVWPTVYYWGYLFHISAGDRTVLISELRDCSSVESFEIKDCMLRSPKLAEWIFLDPEIRLRMRMCIDRMYPAELADIP